MHAYISYMFRTRYLFFPHSASSVYPGIYGYLKRSGLEVLVGTRWGGGGGGGGGVRGLPRVAI